MGASAVLVCNPLKTRNSLAGSHDGFLAQACLESEPHRPQPRMGATYL